MKKITVILFLAVMVAGCIPAAFVAGTAAGTIIYDHRSTKTMVDDRDATFKIQHRFDNDPEFRNGSNLSATCFNHIVLLLGQVPDAQTKSLAESIAKSNSLVKVVYNEITIEKSTSYLTETNDTWITTKVKTVLATTPGLNSSSLKVVTENSVVYLMGLTSKTQAKLAADKTRTVAGVKKVVKLFEYLN